MKDGSKPSFLFLFLFFSLSDLSVDLSVGFFALQSSHFRLRYLAA